jgi:tetratricopeptide (TPR) repeat protein
MTLKKYYCCALVLLICCLFLNSTVIAGNTSNPLLGADDTTQGIGLYRQGNLESALKKLRAAVKGRERNRSAWIYLSLVQHRLGNIEEAVRAFEKAQNVLPDFQSGEATEAWDAHARRAAEETLAVTPDDAEAHYVLGMVKLRLDKHSEARAEVLMALKASPDFILALLLQSAVFFSPQETDSPDSGLACFSNFKASAEALETAIRKLPANFDPAAYLRRLETLRFYANLAGQPEVGRTIFCASKELKPIFLYKEKAKYTEEARSRRIRGFVGIMALLSSDGSLQHLMPVRLLDGGLTETAISATRKVKFKPAVKDGRPVSVVMLLEYTFQIF